MQFKIGQVTFSVNTADIVNGRMNLDISFPVMGKRVDIHFQSNPNDNLEIGLEISLSKEGDIRHAKESTK